MSASIKPVVSISDYISHSGSYSSQASQLHGTLAQVKQMKADTIKQSIYDPYRESLLRWAQQEEKERQVVEGKVKYIMSLYNCDSLTIYESIMETFDPILVATLVAIESNYKPEAISPAGALGLCQVMPFHFRSSDNWKDPKANIGVGSNYLKQLMKQFKGDKELALAAFNAGPNAVIKARYKVPSNRGNETKNYVSRAKKINQLVSR